LNDGDGRDTQYEDAGDDDNSYHGTHVAGTILANGNNGTGITGLSWGARLVTGRALGYGGGSNDDIMSALAWMAGDGSTEAGTLAASNRPRVVNMSLGAANQCSEFEQDVINWVMDQGVIVVAAAGNDGGGVNSPANCQNVVAVGATDSNGSLASYSSFGNEIDVVAPGGEMVSDYNEGVLSLYADFGADPPYTFYQGTSMASPHVAGVVSLMLDINPSLDVTDVNSIFALSGTESCTGCQGKPFLRADLALIEAGAVPPDPEDPPPDDPPPDDPPDGPGPGPDPGGGGGAECDPARGNLDCPDRQGCLVSSESSLGGTCIVGVDGETGIGGLCEDDDECSTGLCVKGVCTTECDEDGDCRDGYDCDEDAIPGGLGLCEPESCKDEGEDFCESDWSCQYSPDENYVCASGGSNYLSCADSRGLGMAPLAAMAALLVIRRRRPRARQR
jgi:Subtilase family